MKVVIVTVPMMKEGKLKAQKYPVGEDKYIEVFSPINSILAKELENGEKIKVIYINTTGENSESDKNMNIFTDELKNICEEKEVNWELTPINIEFLPTNQTYNKIIKELSDNIPENAEIYVDITFSYKPAILSLFCALRFVELFRNAVIQYIVYGKVEFNKVTDEAEKPVLFDITSLYYLFKLMGTMGNADAETATETLKDFFDM